MEAQLRRGWSSNELTGFRYDVWLEVADDVPGGLPETSARPEELRWDQIGSVASVRAALAQQKGEALIVRGVPNARVAEGSDILRWLREGGETATVGAWRKEWARTSSHWCSARSDLEAADALCYEAHVGWGDSAETMDVLFRKLKPGLMPVAAGWQHVRLVNPSLREHTNDPQRAEAGQRLIPALREHLRERLPEHMVPTVFVMLDALPLTPNGKVDRKNLPSHASRPVAQTGGFVAPRNQMERQIARVWQEVLGTETVGAHDNFFDLGGHSLLMVRVHGRLCEVLSRELSIVELLRYPTVSSLAAFVSADIDQTQAATMIEKRASKQREAFARQRPTSSMGSTPTPANGIPEDLATPRE